MTPDQLLALARDAGAPADAGLTTPVAALFDSMAFVGFLGLLADECGVEPADIEEVVGRRFTTLADLANRLGETGVAPGRPRGQARESLPPDMRSPGPAVWLAASAIRLPASMRSAEDTDRLLGRPAGWFRQRTGIAGCRRWGDEDAVEAAASAGLECLKGAIDVSALLVTSEAPPRWPGLAACLHAHLALPPSCAALDVGGACVGVLHALWLARRLARPQGDVLIVAVESPSVWLGMRAGPEGEAAALFAEGAAACRVSVTPRGRPLLDVALGCDGTAADLLRLEPARGLAMRGPALASRAVHAVCSSAGELAARHGVRLGDVVVHAGNGRMAALVARKLGVPAGRVRSRTAELGNLGSASLLAAWEPAADVPGPVIWAAAGAGLNWGAALWGPMA
ncbi:MAG: 3-oxoacyl-[acyl-carrier-protein] synthase III C-terminal domain-containing protein [Gemmataceae bacterium]